MVLPSAAFRLSTFTINAENEIVAFASGEEAATTIATPFDSFTSEQQLRELARTWPGARLIAIWNTLPLGQIFEVKPGLFYVVSGFTGGGTGGSLFSITSTGTVNTIYAFPPQTLIGLAVEATNGNIYGSAIEGYYEAAKHHSAEHGNPAP